VTGRALAVPWCKTLTESFTAQRCRVIILGNNLRGTTTVAFNGIAADFNVISDTEIRTSVPTGATTGYITVTIPERKLKSNVVFRVTKVMLLTRSE
jgi:hypothetical protein